MSRSFKKAAKCLLFMSLVAASLAIAQTARSSHHKYKRKNVKTVHIPSRLMKKSEDRLLDIQGDDPNALSDASVVDPETGAVIGQWLVNPNSPCRECAWADCPDMNDLRKICPAGLVRDACDCCLECASGLGMPCHLSEFSQRRARFPPCGDNLECAHIPDDLYEGESNRDTVGMPQGQCICTERIPVCGSDNVTYDNVCSFQSSVPRSIYLDGVELVMVHDGPCVTEPQIDSRLSDVKVTLGGSATFRCELSGFPAPNIKWFKQSLDKKKSNGQPQQDQYTFSTSHGEWELPGFFPNAVTQVRGGPGTYQITSWLTIDDVTESDAAKYVCRATNEKGTDEESAILTITRR